MQCGSRGSSGEHAASEIPHRPLKMKPMNNNKKLFLHYSIHQLLIATRYLIVITLSKPPTFSFPLPLCPSSFLLSAPRRWKRWEHVSLARHRATGASMFRRQLPWRAQRGAHRDAHRCVYSSSYLSTVLRVQRCSSARRADSLSTSRGKRWLTATYARAQKPVGPCVRRHTVAVCVLKRLSTRR